MRRILKAWVNKRRKSEVDDELLVWLQGADEEKGIEVLNELRNDGQVISSKRKCLAVETWIELENGIRTDALVDSGATNCYINERFVDHLKLPTAQLAKPIGVYNADGSRNSSGSITRTCTIPIRIGPHRESLKCFVVNTGTSSLILGHSWLVNHNPYINWRTNTLRFTNPIPQHSTPNPTFFYDPMTEAMHVDGVDDETGLSAEEEWHEAIVDELGDDGDALLVIDVDDGLMVDDEEPYRCEWEQEKDEVDKWKEWDGVLKKKEKPMRIRELNDISTYGTHLPKNSVSNRISPSLDLRRLGPFSIIQKVGSSAYKVNLPKSFKVHDTFHISKLRPFIPASFDIQSRPSSSSIAHSDSSPSLPVVTTILNHRSLRNVPTSYLVTLDGDSDCDAIWLTPSEFDDPSNLVASYHLSLNNVPKNLQY
ncbi:hypothetical protein CVT24_000215 [Panaeolus cyanescens]|uniref:Tf2-1-like SH3-like domain-containing protein n=1 Tax=Panaeolus cyanescens TaxID=181874 RepID=A0A409WSP3_9AGAR|nr:hypothetical protein CVT24_000215 [Panaeolus cyanescens]